MIQQELANIPRIPIITCYSVKGKPFESDLDALCLVQKMVEANILDRTDVEITQIYGKINIQNEKKKGSFSDWNKRHRYAKCREKNKPEWKERVKLFWHNLIHCYLWDESYWGMAFSFAGAVGLFTLAYMIMSGQLKT